MGSSDSEVSFDRPQEAHEPAIASGIDRDEFKEMIKEAIEGLRDSLMVALTEVIQNVVTTVVQNLKYNANQPHMHVATIPGPRKNNLVSSSRTSRLNSSPLRRDRESSSDSHSQDLEDIYQQQKRGRSRNRLKHNASLNIKTPPFWLQQSDNRGHVHSIRDGRDGSSFCSRFSGVSSPEM